MRGFHKEGESEGIVTETEGILECRGGWKRLMSVGI